MADITYTVNENTVETIAGVESFSQEDRDLVNSFQINHLFDRSKDRVKLHINNLVDELQESDYNYKNYKELGNAQSAGKSGASVVTVDPVDDVKLYGYDFGGVRLCYNFIRDLYSTDASTTDFFIQEISPDRTELKLSTFQLQDSEVLSTTAAIKNKALAESYFNDIRLNFSNNDLLIVTNIDTLSISEDVNIVVKLYEPLPGDILEKSVLSIVELVSDSVVYDVDSVFEQQQVPVNYIQGPNFNIELTDENITPSGYFDYNTLFSYQISNTNSEIYSAVESKGAQLSIDHTSYKNFVQFSSAQERLLNFKYKLDLIQSYYSQIGSIQTITTPSTGTTGSIAYYEALIKGVVGNFDHYEKYLYYESGSSCWPKTNSTKPYTNDTTSATGSWYNAQLLTSAEYDATNPNILTNSIPNYLKDDTSNQNYLTFVYMIGQHFDNLWIYAKGVSDKYDADNRLEAGISKDLIGEVLKNFGVKLYTSNNSIQDLFGSFIGQAYQSGSEDINYYITGSLTGSNTPIQPTSFDNYNKEIQKRIYHNLPLLLKSKGTERGLRALINCFGIPSNVLDIKLYGGTNVNQRPFYGDYQHYTSSLDKIRLDNTGSITPGNTLSQYTSINKREYKYTDDVHSIEVGFSPTDNVDNFIISKSLSTGSLSSFNIDQYLGDPRNMTSDRYELLDSTGSMQSTLLQLADSIMSGSSAYDVQDYVRLIKFFDNTIFKMVKDFIPARSIADTGIIIKPHILHRNKAKSPTVQGTRPEHSASINTAFIRGTDAGIFRRPQGDLIVSNIQEVQTPLGLGQLIYAEQQPKYNGELSASYLQVTAGELNIQNQYKTPIYSTNNFNVYRWANSDNLCIIGTTGIQYLTEVREYQATELFSGINANYQYTHSLQGGVTTQPFNFPLNTANYANYTIHSISASNTTIGACSASKQVQIAICDIQPNAAFMPAVTPNVPYNIRQWFNIGSRNLSSNIIYKLNDIIQLDPTQVNFGSIGSSNTLTIYDNAIPTSCIQSYTIQVSQCALGIHPLLLNPPINTQIGASIVLARQWTNNINLQSGIANIPQNVNTSGLASFFTGVVPGTTYYQIQLVIYQQGAERELARANELIQIHPNTSQTTIQLESIFGEYTLLGLTATYSYSTVPNVGQVANFKLSHDPSSVSADRLASNVRIEVTAVNPGITPACTATIQIKSPARRFTDLYLDPDLADDQFNPEFP